MTLACVRYRDAAFDELLADMHFSDAALQENRDAESQSETESESEPETSESDEGEQGGMVTISEREKSSRLA